MHQVIRLLVNGDNEEEAVETALEAARVELLCKDADDRGRDGNFDYVRHMGESQDWSDYDLIAIPSDSERGRQEIQNAWNTTQEKTLDKIEEIKSTVESSTTEELANDRYTRMIMTEMSAYEPGTNHYLFTTRDCDSTFFDEPQFELEPISTQDHIESVEEGHLNREWVVPLDAHY